MATPAATKSRLTSPTSRAELLAMPLDDVIFMMLDTETTGADPAGDHCGPHKVIELAVLPFSVKARTRMRGGMEQIVDPGRPISPGSSTAHSLVNKDVAGSPSLEEVMPRFEAYVQDWPLVAYNSAFDYNMLKDTSFADRVWIDAYRVAMHVWAVGDKNKEGFPLESLKQQELRYWLGLENIEGQAHRAMADIIVTGMIFSRGVKHYRKLGLGGDTLGDFINWVDSPLQLRTIPVGTRKMVGKTPAQLSMFDLKRIFDPSDALYETYKRFNIDTFCEAEYMQRKAIEHAERMPPAATRNSVKWGAPPEAEVPAVDGGAETVVNRPRRNRP